MKLLYTYDYGRPRPSISVEAAIITYSARVTSREGQVEEAAARANYTIEFLAKLTQMLFEAGSLNETQILTLLDGAYKKEEI